MHSTRGSHTAERVPSAPTVRGEAASMAAKASRMHSAADVTSSAAALRPHWYGQQQSERRSED